MTSLTGIEIGPDSCVVICARREPGGDLTLSFAHRLEFPSTGLRDGRLVRALHDLRRSAALPRQLFCVSWMSESVHDVLVHAGFDVRSVISPSQALTLLASDHADPGRNGVAWIALNRHGAAFSIVCGPRLLFTRTFDWTVARAPLPASVNAQLLRRYLYVSQLAPELQHAIKAVHARYGIRVGSAVTCGDMPDLRSLAMPLIDELDLEVDTLDSAAGLTIAEEAGGRSLLDAAPAVRLVCAALDAPQPASRLVASPQLIRRAAAVLSVMLVTSAGWTAWAGRTTAPPTPPAAPARQSALPPAITPMVLEGMVTPDVRLVADTDSSIVTPPVAGAPVQIPVPAPTSGSIVPEVRPTRGVTSTSLTGVDRPHARAFAADGGFPVTTPTVDLILMGTVRNVALVDGRFVEVGDDVGDLQVLTIDPSVVVLRDRQGVAITVRAGSVDSRLARRAQGTPGSRQP
jgi:hypothetical protein